MDHGRRDRRAWCAGSISSRLKPAWWSRNVRLGCTAGGGVGLTEVGCGGVEGGGEGGENAGKVSQAWIKLRTYLLLGTRIQTSQVLWIGNGFGLVSVPASPRRSFQELVDIACPVPIVTHYLMK